MKILVLALALLTGIFTKTVSAQENHKESLLSAYYGIKNALVNADAATASAKAGEFMSQLKAAEISENKDNLLSAAAKIAENKDLVKQREAFAGLSADFFKLAQTAKLSAQPVYYQYCPMKKSYWLSASKDIKNPYYGKQMLTCGRVEETIE